MNDHISMSHFKHRQSKSKRITKLVNRLQLTDYFEKKPDYKRRYEDFVLRMAKRGIKVNK